MSNCIEIKPILKLRLQYVPKVVFGSAGIVIYCLKGSRTNIEVKTDHNEHE